VNTTGADLSELKRYNRLDNVIIWKCSTRLYSDEHFHFLRQNVTPILRAIAYCNYRRMRAASRTVELEISGIKYLYTHAALQKFDLETFLSLTDLARTLHDALAFIRTLAVFLKSGRSLKKIDGFVGEPMSLTSFITHWTNIRKYITFSWKRALDYLVIADEQKLTLIMAMLRIKEELDNLSDSVPKALGLRVLREPELRKVISAFIPANKVFKQGLVAARNCGICQ